uniref:Uncharacterized protein n=1 Tax=Drosophila melanogaster TaxID=7227 RepID=A0A384SYE0_DROME|nr:uncharacterized protein Dmel_CG44388 [Drosophila melanogaster]API64974.1 uncharacterized protein Dmel_CG44388 [Drosophila melanogaster]|eukprot:NP_001334725.1 uncharacterized protein Dmel_CG44388 [Drosophila melanogaster]
MKLSVLISTILGLALGMAFPQARVPPYLGK